MTNLERGQSLFELVVAVAVCALIIIAVVSLTVNSIANSNFSRNKALAATYAQQATEWLRGQRDSNTDIFISNAENMSINPMCLNDLTSWSLAPCTAGSTIAGTPFTRQVTFTVSSPGGKNIVETDVAVTWSDSQGIHEVINATNFADLRQR
jgi:Tfp pilus assembly protein PilV